MVPLTGIAISSVVIFGLGGFIAASYSGPRNEFLSLWDVEELLWNILICLVYVPGTWLSYIWQTHAFSSMLMTLNRNGLLHKRRNISDKIRELVVDRKINKWIWVFPAGLTALAIWAWASAPECPGSSWCYEKSITWISTEKWYPWFPYGLVIFGDAYMVAWIIVRQFAIWGVFSSLFISHKLEPQLYHEDGRNGLKCLRNFLVGSTAIAVFQALWVFLITFWPGFFGQPIMLIQVSLGSTIAYFVSVPFFLLPPLLLIHRALVQSKEEHLGKIGKQIRAQLKYSTPKKISESKNLLEALKLRWEMVESEQRTLPFRQAVVVFSLLAIIGFLINTAVPITLTIIDIFFTQRP
ncbi:MAG TPA: hypothetical protein VJ183_09580 [Chloroflexia bacterium]|nr:hypothetical protein [Chloroflexia bacterium]